MTTCVFQKKGKNGHCDDNDVMGKGQRQRNYLVTYASDGWSATL